MPESLTYPGVYVHEVPSEVHTIVGVPTSVAAFVGSAPIGALNVAKQINSWTDFQRNFGSLDVSYPMSWAVYLYFLNGGAVAQVVRAGTGGTPTKINVGTDDKSFVLTALTPGGWGDALTVTVDRRNITQPAAGQSTAFNLTIARIVNGTTAASERYLAVTTDTLATALARSQLVAVDSLADKPNPPADGSYLVTGTLPAAAGPAGAVGDAGAGAAVDGGGAPAPAPAKPSAKNAAGTDPSFGSAAALTGMQALAKVDIFNMLCLPTLPTETHSSADLGTAAQFCKDHRAVLIVDPPGDWPDEVDFQTATGDQAAISASAEAAVYYPNLVVTDSAGGTHQIGPSGAIAGVWATTDRARGVWKAPAGTTQTWSGSLTWPPTPTRA